MAPAKLIFGSGLFTKDFGFNSADDVKPWLDVLLKNKDLVGEIDTAAIYQTSEDFLGQLKFGEHFAIGTKVYGGSHPAQPATKENVIAQAKASLGRLGIDQLDILFIHCPDARIPLADTLAGIDALHKEGAFRRFGLANFTAAQVEEVLATCAEHNFVKPTVFSGSYSAVSRLPEDSGLMALLRKHDIAFYAYSPAAGGFLAKSSAQFKEDNDAGLQGRWDPKTFLGGVYCHIYRNEKALDVLDRWNAIAEAEGISGSEMAYRWVVHNSVLDGAKGDGVIVGATTLEQWTQTIDAIQKGSLKQDTVDKIQALWEPSLNPILDNWEAILGFQAAMKAKAEQ